MAIQEGLDRAYAECEALHYVNAPAHAHALVDQLHGLLSELHSSREDDPLLYACQCLDRLPLIAGLTIAIEKWAVAVNEATPDQIQDHGAQLCP